MAWRALLRSLGALTLALLLAMGLGGVGRITYDATYGVVLSAEDADVTYRPASLSKLMTAYVAFEALGASQIAEDATTSVSSYAARTPPVKLGLSAGTEVKFVDALAAAVVGSANDMAVVVAEAVAGSEAAFVERMNAAAERLGMTRTRFSNPHGLPADPPARTTARDMARLAAALVRDHPGRLALFKRSAVRAGGRRISTTNPLIGGFEGAEGLKTGFTCAAGYAMVGMARRGGRRIIAVALGHAGKSARNSDIRSMLRAGFDAEAKGEPLTAAVASDTAPRNVGVCQGGRPRRASQAVAAATTARPSPVRPRRPAPPPRPQPPPLRGWGVFLGTAADAASAGGMIRQARALGGSGGWDRAAARSDSRWSAAIYDLAKPAALRLCQRIKAGGRYCVVLSPETVINPRADWRR